MSFITLGVADLQRSLGFYRDVLGLRPRTILETVVFFEMGPTWLALHPREMLALDAGVDPAGSGFSGITLAHNVASIEEVDALLTQAVAGGATLKRAGSPADWGGYTGYFADPDGHLWEIAWNPEFPL
ncbi:VOC family protein [Chitinibacter sp. S2-10]|uniref:VOC family protein n=1 Tax=Chitinibacter sp. S2-10 TaxID=3373597 RepID=UPI0039779758